MFDNPKELLDKIRLGESTFLECFDEQPVSMAELDDLSPDLWERFRTPRSDDDREVLLRKLGIASADDDGTLRPTVAGVLMASDPRRWLPNAYIQAVAYRGDQIQSDAPGGYQLDAADIAGWIVRLRKPVGSLPEI